MTEAKRMNEWTFARTIGCVHNNGAGPCEGDLIAEARRARASEARCLTLLEKVDQLLCRNAEPADEILDEMASVMHGWRAALTTEGGDGT